MDGGERSVQVEKGPQNPAVCTRGVKRTPFDLNLAARQIIERTRFSEGLFHDRFIPGCRWLNCFVSHPIPDLMNDYRASSADKSAGHPARKQTSFHFG